VILIGDRDRKTRGQCVPNPAGTPTDRRAASAMDDFTEEHVTVFTGLAIWHLAD